MPASLSGRFGLTSVPAEGVKRLSAPSQATDSLEDQAPTNDLGEPPCPFNVAKFEDHKQCGRKSLPKEACADESNSTTFKQKRDVQRQCKRMCNPDCDPTRAISRLPMNVNYFPLAKIVRGHQFCKARYTVSTQPDATLNRATGQVVQMPVCAKCISNNYYLQPAYASGGQVFGNCAPLTKNILWVEANKACSSASKEPAPSPVGINFGQEQVAVRLADSDEDSTTGRRRKKTETAAPPPPPANVRRRKKTETAAPPPPPPPTNTPTNTNQPTHQPTPPPPTRQPTPPPPAGSACKPWFVHADSGVRAYIAQYREELLQKKSKEC